MKLLKVGECVVEKHPSHCTYGKVLSRKKIEKKNKKKKKKYIVHEYEFEVFNSIKPYKSKEKHYHHDLNNGPMVCIEKIDNSTYDREFAKLLLGGEND